MTRDAKRIRKALEMRGYVVAEEYTKRQMQPPAVWCYEDDDPAPDGTRPVLWAWTIPYHPAGKPNALSTLHAPNVWDALDQIERLTGVVTCQ